jgi:superfamily II DNA or RNA helicase
VSSSIITNRKEEEIPFRQSSSSDAGSKSVISNLRFPFKLTKDQVEAVGAWVSNAYRGSIIYSTGTGKTEIAFECARRRAIVEEEDKTTCHNNIGLDNNNDYSSSYHDHSSSFNILFLVPRIILIEQNVRRLVDYNIPQENIGIYFGEEKELR